MHCPVGDIIPIIADPEGIASRSAGGGQDALTGETEGIFFSEKGNVPRARAPSFSASSGVKTTANDRMCVECDHGVMKVF